MTPNPRSRQFERPKKGVFSRFKAVFVLLALGAVIAVTPLDARVEQQLEFPAAHLTVIDAGTVAYGSIQINLKGVHATQRGTPGYEPGRQFLIDLRTGAKTARCDLSGERINDQRLGRCYLMDATGTQTDLQSAVVSAGFARSCIRHGGWRYIAAETEKSRSLPFPRDCFGLSIW